MEDLNKEIEELLKEKGLPIGDLYGLNEEEKKRLYDDLLKTK